MCYCATQIVLLLLLYIIIIIIMNEWNDLSELSMEVTLQQISLFFAEECRATCTLASDRPKATEGILLPFVALAGSAIWIYLTIKHIIGKLVMKISLISC